ncbi:MAG: ATP-dependent helicase [Candidatus Omnitrophica bacterium]|nr:ATP-dependent helicase [Candidatus Omnitrophota bacterium]
MPIDYKKELNPAQLEAVRMMEGPCLVIAGAGSGKTRILVYRVAHLVEKGVNPEEILLLSFTRKSAQEMLLRAALILDERCKKVSGGTFHSFANMVLRKHARRVGMPNNFTIMDQSDAENAVNLVRKKLGFGSADNRFPRKKALINIISKSVNAPHGISLVIESEYPHFAEYAESIKKIKRSYAEYKKGKGLFDYDDLLVYLKKLLSSNKEIQAGLSRKYKYIMVDEYQDTNKLQADILYLLLSGHKNIMAVGDDSQSIYAFRGANFKNIIDFPNIFKGSKIITLEENYRSVQPILDLTNKIIGFAAEKFRKNLFTRKKGVNMPHFIETENENRQSEHIVEKVTELRSRGIKLGDIAVLFRSGWHSNDLEIGLSRNSIPFIKYGGRKFVESSHVKDLISHLRVFYNINDEISWNRVLTLMRGVGPKTAEKMFKKITQDKNVLSSDDNLFKKAKDAERLSKVFEEARDEDKTPFDIIKMFNAYYEPIFRERYDDFHKRVNDLGSLERIALRYGRIEDFLTDMALEPPEEGAVKKNNDNADRSKLVLSTIHSAKGLEWHTVFIIHVSEGCVPSYQSIGNDDSIEEERRLLYVAMTRAKENLYMLKPMIDLSPRNYLANKGGPSFTEISRFLREGDILKKYIDYRTEIS